MDIATWLARHGDYVVDGPGYHWDYEAAIPAHDPRALATAPTLLAGEDFIFWFRNRNHGAKAHPALDGSPRRPICAERRRARAPAPRVILPIADTVEAQRE